MDRQRITRPIKKTVLTASITVFIILAVILLVLSNFFVSSALKASYNSKLDDVITYVEHIVDADDLKNCLETGEHSEKYDALQQTLNTMVDDFELEYLYIVVPTEEVMLSAISATSEAERAEGAVDMEILEATDAYSREELKRYLSYWDSDESGFFEESSDWGNYHTLVKALRDSNGETVALMCADLSVEDLNRSLFTFMMFIIIVIALVCAAAAFILIKWLKNNITDPILELEKSSYDFVEKAKSSDDMGALSFEVPEIKQDNEVRSLARTISIMAEDMKKCIIDTSTAEEEARSEGEAYSRLAHALSTDYFNIFDVNLDTEQFIEYTSPSFDRSLSQVRTGENFFEQSRTDAAIHIHPDDREAFIKAFHKDTIIRAMDETGAFTIQYRLLLEDGPVHVSMKATRTEEDDNHAIFGVNSIEAQMRVQEAAERIREERTTYARITALSGDYILVYTVDPKTDHYMSYAASKDTFGHDFTEEGDDFFLQAQKEFGQKIYVEDLEKLNRNFTKKKVMAEIEKKGMYVLDYRLMVEGIPTYVRLKAAIVEEKDGPQIIIGVSDIDEQVRREQEYNSTLQEARMMANRDGLTGVKNKHAYIDIEAQINEQIEEGRKVEFALVVFDMNDLKTVNDTLGHQAGDDYIREASRYICNVFKRSPVFRIGGDEFAVIAQGHDYQNIDSLIEEVNANNESSRESGGRLILACGMAKYENDRSVEAVFERADARMYENKKGLKTHKS